MEKRTAVVFGATGLVGRYLVDELITSDSYSHILILVRRPAGFTGEKCEERIFDFGNPSGSAGIIRGDDLFICLGTTIRKAGSVKKMEEIDRDLPLTIAGIASANGMKRVAVVSSIGANDRSSNYYLRIKGEMEKGLPGRGFKDIAIVRPSILLGKREEKRFGEAFGRFFMSTFGFLFAGRLKKFRGIHGRDVARAMVRILLHHPGIKIYESDELIKISRE